MGIGRDDAVFRVGSDVSGAISGMDRVSERMHRMQAEAAFVERAMATLGVATGVAAVGGLALLAKNAIDANDHLNDMAKKAQITVESMGGIGFAASMAGSSVEGVAGALGKLNLKIAEAVGGSKDVIGVFNAIGVSFKDASGNARSAEAVFTDVAAKMASYEDGPKASAIANALFGKSYAEVMPLLKDGGDALKENIEYFKKYSGTTADLAARADAFNDTMTKLAVQQKSFGNALAAQLLPNLQAVADELLKGAENSDKYKVAARGVGIVFETLVVLGANVAFVFDRVGSEIGGIAAQMAALGRGDFKAFSAISEAMKEDSAIARANLDAFERKILGLGPASVNENGTAPPPKKTQAPGLPNKDADKEAARIEEDRRDMLARMGKAAEDEVRLMEKQASALSDAEQKIKDARARVAEAMNPQIGEERIHDEKLQALNNYYATHLDRMAEWNYAIESEAARHQLALQAIARQQEDDRNASNRAYQQLDAAQLSAAGTAASSMAELIRARGQENTELGKIAFAAAKALGVAQLVMQANIAAAATEAGLITAAATTAGAMGPAGPVYFGVMSAEAALAGESVRTLGYLNAGLTAAVQISGAREKGGPVWPGGSFIVGEKGPEIFTPSRSGTIIPNSRIGSGGGAMQLTIVNNTRSPIGQVTEQRISDTERALIIEEAVGVFGAQLGDPNSRPSRAMNRNFAVQRSR